MILGTFRTQKNQINDLAQKRNLAVKTLSSAATFQPSCCTPHVAEPPVNMSGMPRQAITLSRYEVMVLLGGLIVLGCVRLVGMFLVPLTDTTEARYAEIARKMVETQDWITPQFDYQIPFWGKPPLHTWLSALGMELFGVNAFGARILIFICAIMLLFLVFRWVRRSVGTGTGLCVVSVLSSSILFFGASAFVMTDLVLVFGTTLVMMSLWQVMCAEAPQSRAAWPAFVGLAIGLLAKGPVALVLCVIPIALWALLSGQARSLLRVRWGTGALLTLLLALPWYVMAELKTPGFLNYFLVGEHFERFTVPDWQGDLYGSGHERPKGAIWADWTLAFLPWSLFLIPLILKPSRLKSAFVSDRSGWLLYLLCWSLSPMILFTLSANILAAYTLPSLPAASILIVCLYSVIWSGADQSIIRVCFAGGLLGTLAVWTIMVTLAHVQPDALKLRSAKVLVSTLGQIDKDATLYYLGRRSYSGEFYTHGHAQVIPDLSQLNDHIQALAVPLHNEASELEKIADDFERIGQFGRHVLFYRSLPASEGKQ